MIVVCGPTASGKTDVAIMLAQLIESEIISSDSMQIYKHMDIGTAKPTAYEQSLVQHHMIDCIEPDADYNVALYQKDATQIANTLYGKNMIPIIAGGTGLYIQSLLEPVTFTDATKDETIRLQLEKEANKKGNEYLHNKLQAIDKEAAEAIHPNNIRRTIRALEVYYTTGKTLTAYKKENKESQPTIDAIKIGLTMDRGLLYQRINQRVDKMLEAGLVEEVEHLLKMGYNPLSNALQAIGYKEIIAYLEGRYSLEESIELVKQGSRRYAKRQLTWFRRQEDIKWFDATDFNGANQSILAYCNQRLKG